MDAAAFGSLVTAEGQHLLAEATAAYDGSDPLALSQRLRAADSSRSPEQVSAAVTQVVLRRAAASKFGPNAERMYFTATGLEQASHPAVAAHRAGRIQETGAQTCLDLCCGIGSDLLALGRSGLAVTGIDRDCATAMVARANLEGLGIPGAVSCANAEDVGRTPFDVVYADPSRRLGNARVFDPGAFSPPWQFVSSLLEVPGSGSERLRHGVVKLAPGLDHAMIAPHVEAEWVSFDGQLKETTLWSPAPSDVRRRATLLRADGRCVVRTDENAPTTPPRVADVGRYVYEPDAALIRAHLVSVVAEEVAGWLVDPHIAYVSSDRQVPTPLARCFRVLDRLPFREKPLRQALRARNVGALTIKKRGIAVTPEALRRRLGLHGDQQATLIMTRTPRSAVALLVEAAD